MVFYLSHKNNYGDPRINFIKRKKNLVVIFNIFGENDL